MEKVIVTTTVNPPTEALQRYAELEDWTLIVVGDQKTPHETYEGLRCLYLSPDKQQQSYPELSSILGWNTIQRRNIGFVEAWRSGAELIATIDDDNIPLAEWGQDIVAGKTIPFVCYSSHEPVFDPLSATNQSHLWHRGYPVQLLANKNQISRLGIRQRRVLAQANLWNGDPDVDAIGRIALRPEVKFDVDGYYGAVQIAPFNSQNTILHRDAFPSYCVLPFVGRMDDIWASYLFQREHTESVVFGPATVFQERNEQDLVKNLADEMLGYKRTLELIEGPADGVGVLPEATLDFINAYRKCFA